MTKRYFKEFTDEELFAKLKIWSRQSGTTIKSSLVMEELLLRSIKKEKENGL